MGYTPNELDPLELALLGALSVGLPPSKAAGDETLRLDHVTAVVFGLLSVGERSIHLAPDGVQITLAFRAELRAAIFSLTAKGIVAEQAAGMPAAAGGFEAGLEIDMVNPDEHPALMDRYLGQECMERLFNVPAVYPYLMERYARGGEVWRRLRDSGYARD